MEHYRSVFISDVHLGTKMCQAELLLDFLKTFECDNLYLVGDLIDGWALSKNFFWPQSHNDVIQEGVNGSMDDDLASAINKALVCDRADVAATASRWDWRACTEIFINNLTQIPR